MRVAAVVNPTKADDGTKLRHQFEEAVSARAAELLWLETTVEDPGLAMTSRALSQGVDLVLASGGDGTVRACADRLADSGVPLAIVPLGTGNLLARNLDLPLDIEASLDVALNGDTRRIDIGKIVGPSGTHRFAVMAGMGFDAALFAGTDDKLKERVGPLAYVASGLRHLTDRPMHLRVTSDGAARTYRAASVLLGNVGTLQAGVELLPDARPDDGLLDVAILEPDGLIGWVRMAGQILTRRRRNSEKLKRFRAEQVELRVLRPRPWQLDGDPMGTATKLTVAVEPGALLVRVPRSAE